VNLGPGGLYAREFRNFRLVIQSELGLPFELEFSFNEDTHAQLVASSSIFAAKFSPLPRSGIGMRCDRTIGRQTK